MRYFVHVGLYSTLYKNVDVYCARRIRVQRDSAMMMKMIEFVRVESPRRPRTVDFVLDSITDFAFSLWAALYINEARGPNVSIKGVVCF
jgi:hypothetical protein